MDVEFDGLRLIAGESVLDFLNSVKFRGKKEPGDRLKSFKDLCRWCLTSRILTDLEYKKVVKLPSKRVLEDALDLREAFREFLDDCKDAERCRKLEALLSRSNPQLRLLQEERRVIYQVEINTSDDVVRRLEHKIANFLKRWQPQRTKSCQAIDCDWVFSDQTKSNKRRWCDSRTCGNRERVQRYRHKQSR